MFRFSAGILTYGVACLLLQGCGKPPEPAKPVSQPSKLTESEKDTLVQYDAVRGRLAADDLAGAKDASRALADIAAGSNGKTTTLEAPSRELAEAADLKKAREIFTRVSAAAISVVDGEPGYYVMECGMFEKGDWVQTDKKLANPYMGKAMLECGALKQPAVAPAQQPPAKETRP